MLDLDSIVPLVERKLPFIDIQRCTIESNGNTYDGLAFVHTEMSAIPERVFMITLAVVEAEVVLGIHASHRQENMARPLKGCTEGHLASLLVQIWGGEEPN